ncbi:MAG: hypothetical protein H7Z43_08350 [Clostridia bacterium]|nr:hypothetical protein [Deltaproteobacteria bacterium]
MLPYRTKRGPRAAIEEITVRYPILPLALCSVLAVSACGSDETIGTTTESADAVPDAQMLAITTPSTTDDQALSTDPSTINAAAEALADDVNDAVGLLQSKIDQLRATATVQTTTVGLTTCDVWIATIDAVAYRLSACERERLLQTHTFILEAHAATSTDDKDYVTVAAGHGGGLKSYEGERRGYGTIAYDFDALRTIRGSGPSGKIAIGYRAAGQVRQLAISYKGFAYNESVPQSARITYKRIVGTGGKITFATYADVLAPGPNAGSYVNGTDGLDENARVSLGWLASGSARAAAFACGGTVGQGACVHVAQCYSVSGSVSYEQIVAGTASVSFSATDCSNADVDDAPSDDDMTVSTDASADLAGAPAVDEPVADANE